MSSICFSFRPDAIPAYAQAEFLTRFCQLVLDYQTLTEPVQPSAFVPVDGDETTGPQAQKKERKNPWAGLSEEQRAERLAAMKRGRELKKQEKRRLSADSLEAAAVVPKTLEQMEAKDLYEILGELLGVPADSPQFRDYRKYPNKEALIAEIHRLRAAPVPLAPVVAEDAVSESSSKQRKNPWADLTPEQKAERVAKMNAARKAKKEAASQVAEK